MEEEEKCGAFVSGFEKLPSDMHQNNEVANKGGVNKSRANEIKSCVQERKC